MLAQQPQYKQIFASVIKPVVSEEKDRLLAIASLQELSTFIPYIDVEKNVDLLPVAFDACVINRGNKNGDLIDTETALATYKSFIHKFIDTEHNRQKIIGVILTASLSEFGTGRPLREEDVRGTDKPFNVTLGGVLWRAVNENLCDLVEESNDPTSEHYMAVSASWELGFTGFKVIEMEQNARNFSEGKVISDPEFLSSIKPYLKCFKGSGVKNGKSYYRMPSENVVAMGIGLTEKPAADVKGIAVDLPSENAENTESSDAQAVAETKNVEEIAKSFSQQEQNTVKVEREVKIMKITSVDQITDETLKQCTASVMREFIADELKKADAIFSKEKEAQASANTKLQATADGLAKTVNEMKASLETLTKEREERAKLDAYNVRMAETVASYEFPEDVAKVVASDLKAIASDEAYASWKQKAETLFKPYSRVALAAIAKAKADAEAAAKSAKADDEESEAKAKKAPPFEKKDDKSADKKDDKKEDKKDAKASEEAIASAVEDALDNADKKDGGIPNSSSASVKNLKERFATAFAEENFVITK